MHTPFTPEQAQDVWDRMALGVPALQISRELRVPYHHVMNVKNPRYWGQLDRSQARIDFLLQPEPVIQGSDLD